LNDCVSKSMWERCDDVLPVLRHFAMKSPVTELDLKAEYVELVTAFLLGVRERRRPQRARVAETAKAFARSQIWEQQVLRNPVLLQIVSPASAPPVGPSAEEIVEPQLSPTEASDSSPWECQVRLASAPPAVPPAEEIVEPQQSPTEASDSSPWECQLSPVSVPPVASPRPEVVVEPPQPPAAASDSFLWECQASDQDHQKETTSPFESTPHPIASSSLAAEAANSTSPLIASVSEEPLLLSVADEFHQGIQAVLGINSHVLFENCSVSAFVQLRRGALHAAQLPNGEFDEILHAEVEHCVPVFCFLVRFVNSNPIRNRQVCEVLNILLNCPRWREAGCENVAHCFEEHTPPEVREVIEERLHTKRGGKEIGNFAKNAKKQLKRWIFGCGQKRGEGVSSPRALPSQGGA
jgi:hypothetical protein